MNYLNKLSTIICAIIGLAFTQHVFAQGNPSPEATERGIVPELGLPNNAGAGGESSGDVTASDAGAQRPVKLKKKGVSTFFGYSSKYFYRSNLIPIF